MKYILCLIGLCFTHFAQAQLRHETQSAPFKESAQGATKIFQCANGNTVIVVCERGEFRASIFGPELNLVNESEYKLERKCRFVNVFQILETEAGVVVIYSKTVQKNSFADHIPVIAQVVLNPATGQWSEEHIVLNAEQNRMSGSLFVLQKQQRGPYYMVNTNNDKTGKICYLHVFGFDAKNQLKDSSTIALETKYLYRIISADESDGKLFILTSLGYELREYETGDYELHLIVFDKSTRKMETKALSGLSAKAHSGVLTYNERSKKLFLFMTEIPKVRPRGTPVMPTALLWSQIDLEKFSLSELKSVYPDSLNVQYRKYNHSAQKLDLTPVDVQLDVDGNMFLFCESIKKKYTNGFGDCFPFTIDYFDYSFNGTLPGISNTAGFESQLLDLVLLKMSPEGALLNQVLIPKNQFSPFQNYPLFYHYRMRHFLPNLYYSNQYRSYFFIPHSSKPLMLLNDYPQNIEKLSQGDELKTFYPIKEGAFMQVPLTQAGIQTNRLILQNKDKQDFGPGVITSLNYDESKRILVGLTLQDKKWVLHRWKWEE